MPTARSIVEGEVRELVRRRGLDPVAEPPAVARLIDEAVADYQDRATTSQLPPLGDPPTPRAPCSTRSPGSDRCSRSSTTRRSKRSGSTSRAGCSSPGAAAPS